MALTAGTRMHDSAEINKSTASGPVRTMVPVTGDTITLGGERPLYVAPAGTIAALTIKLPPAPADSDIIEISFGQIVTALTVQDGAGNAVQSTAGAVGTAIQYRFVGGAWVRWR